MACFVISLVNDGFLSRGSENARGADTSALVTMLQLKNASQIIYKGLKLKYKYELILKIVF